MPHGRGLLPIAREGLPFVVGLGLLALLAFSFWRPPAAVPFVGLAALTIWFFRDPEREVPEGEGIILSPADGRVIAVEEVFEPEHLDDRARKVSIFMTIFDVHVNRVPAAGQVERVAYRPGRFMAANRRAASMANEHNAVLLKSAWGKLLVVQVAGLVARRIVCWIKQGDLVAAGQRFGLIRFGSRLDVYMPLETRVMVSRGQRVRSGQSVLGYLV